MVMGGEWAQKDGRPMLPLKYHNLDMIAYNPPPPIQKNYAARNGTTVALSLQPKLNMPTMVESQSSTLEEEPCYLSKKE